MSPNDNHPYPGDEGTDKMAPKLVINDGIPWYVSADIWVVPGNNPNSLAGPAQVGGPNWVWARVWNDGNASIYNATVNFYWADPSTIITRQNAKLIGSEYVSIPAKQYKHIYCTTPWQPPMANQGHVCLIVEAYDPIFDPLPNPGSPDFNVITDRHVAQHNLILAINAAGMPLVYQIFIANPAKGASQMVEVLVDRFPLANLAGLAQFAGLAPLKEAAQAQQAEVLGWKAEAANAEGFHNALEAAMVASVGGRHFNRQPTKAQPTAAHAALNRLRETALPVQRIQLRPNELQRLALVIPPLTEAQGGEACAYAITQKIKGVEVGGVLVLVMADPPPRLTVQQRRNMLLEQRLAERPDILRRLLDEPAAALAELDLTLDDLRCPEEVAESAERAEKAAAAMGEIEHLPLEERLPRLREIAIRYLGNNFRVEKVPFGLQFVEQASGSANMDWTATGTIICTFHPGCGTDTDG